MTFSEGFIKSARAGPYGSYDKLLFCIVRIIRNTTGDLSKKGAHMQIYIFIYSSEAMVGLPVVWAASVYWMINAMVKGNLKHRKQEYF
ncbi:MAG: hypothetical protein DSY43_05925 [Gammaproteobacteria bacterium]|nr:MAG: hypothetical protein DSY43_05925 [Gammaproteobacteria bacterium]